MSAIGVFLRGLRQGRQWDMDVVAERTGFSVDKVRCDESGQTVPSFDDRRAYASAFDFPHVEEFERGWRPRKVEVIRGDRNGGIAIINKCPAGRPHDYEEYSINSGVGYEYFARTDELSDPTLFGVIIVGDSIRDVLDPKHPR